MEGKSSRFYLILPQDGEDQLPQVFKAAKCYSDVNVGEGLVVKEVWLCIRALTHTFTVVCTQFSTEIEGSLSLQVR